MIVPHNHRRKTIRRFKCKYGKPWHNHFMKHAAAIKRADDGPLLGTIYPSVGGLADASLVASVSP